ncbi:hypothetical protein, partial [Kistimonas scapharcae]|uniref:hypothetical protein n=1 Tax=Kistimonas scapharcae TaxID=1036133 RepID=UPI0031EDBA8B
TYAGIRTFDSEPLARMNANYRNREYPDSHFTVKHDKDANLWYLEEEQKPEALSASDPMDDDAVKRFRTRDPQKAIHNQIRTARRGAQIINRTLDSNKHNIQKKQHEARKLGTFFRLDPKTGELVDIELRLADLASLGKGLMSGRDEMHKLDDYAAAYHHALGLLMEQGYFPKLDAGIGEHNPMASDRIFFIEGKNEYTLGQADNHRKERLRDTEELLAQAGKLYLERRALLERLDGLKKDDNGEFVIKVKPKVLERLREQYPEFITRMLPRTKPKKNVKKLADYVAPY